MCCVILYFQFRKQIENWIHDEIQEYLISNRILVNSLLCVDCVRRSYSTEFTHLSNNGNGISLYRVAQPFFRITFRNAAQPIVNQTIAHRVEFFIYYHSELPVRLACLQLYAHFTFHTLYSIYTIFILYSFRWLHLSLWHDVQWFKLASCSGEGGRERISVRRTLYGRVIGKATALRWCSVQAPIILMSRRLLCVFLFYHPDYNYSFCFIHEQPQTEHDQTPCQTREIVCVCAAQSKTLLKALGVCVFETFCGMVTWITDKKKPF